MSTISPAAAIRATPERAFVRVSELPGSPEAARKAASRAAADGDLVPVRRGLYYRGKRTRYGMTRPSVPEVVNEVLGTRGVGASGYTAARVWGVTTQVPVSFEVSTLRTADAIPGVEQRARRNIDRVDLNAKEIALLELLRAPDVYVEAGWEALVAKVRKAMSNGEVRMARVAKVVPGERNVAVRANFRRLNDDMMRSAA